jgi:Ran GTPase-activating protein (RanGAP) involved in mRNA processing and transport
LIKRSFFTFLNTLTIMVWGGNDNAVDRWVKQLEENDPKLVSLHILSFRRISTSELGRIFRAIGTNTVLRDLYVSGHALDATSIDYLSESLTLNDTLRTLNLGNTSFGQNTDIFGLFCEGLAANEGLQKLDLENKGIDNPEAIRLLAEALANNKHLEEINLARNSLNDQAIELLAPALTGLLRVNLGINNIGPLGASVLARQLLAPLSKVQELELSDNPLLEGARHLALALENNQQLRVLKLVDVVSNEVDPSSMTLPPPSLGPMDMSNGGKLDEEEAKKKLTDETRTLHGNALMQALGKSLAANTTLTHVWLDNNAIESSALVNLQQSLATSALVEFKLRQNRIDDHGAMLLASVESNTLCHLELGENAIGAKGFGALLDTQQLEYLGLFNNKVGGFGADPSLLPELLSSSVLRLDIGCNGLIHQDVEAMTEVLLKKGVPQLTLLEMGGNVEDKEIELWEATLNRLLEERESLEVIWKRKPSQMESAPPPVL